MKRFGMAVRRFTTEEKGAALPMVILMTLLLATASIALISAASSAARTSTDVLSETKAYYAAESGIQATVNALRFKGADGGPLDYKAAVNNFANSSNMATWMTYTDCDGDTVADRVTISGSCENGYAVHVRDPDNSQSNLSYGTSGAQFRQINANGTFGAWTSTRQVSDGSTGGMTTIEWVPNSPNPSPLYFSEGTPSVSTSIGGFRVSNAGPGGASFSTATEFQVFYSLVIPGNPGWMITGTIGTNGAIELTSARYIITGSEIRICGDSLTGCSLTLPPVANSLAEATTPIPAVITPKEPHRLVVTSTGFGPNSASKKLEAVVQKSPLDGMNSVSPFTMLGPCFEAGNPTNTFLFRAGTSATTSYSGSSEGGVNMPAFAFNQECNLTTANTWIDNNLDRDMPGPSTVPQVDPPPAYFPDAYLPEWQRSPQQMELKVNEYRAQAQYTQTYYNPHPGPKITNPNWVTGMTTNPTGVTFCEGNCTVDGDKGGGVLVVTGKLTSLGGFGFKGLILITGPGGWERAGGGCGRIIGNVVISPYTSADLVNNVFTLPPKYEITGAGCSGVEYASLDDLLQGENESFTNVVRGVAEK